MSSSPQLNGLGSKDDVAKRLANAHKSLDPSISGVFRLEAPGKETDPNEPIKLLEVSSNTPASGIMPVRFAPHAPSGIYYPTIIVEIHSSEWDRVLMGTLSLPQGWLLNKNPL